MDFPFCHRGALSLSTCLLCLEVAESVIPSLASTSLAATFLSKVNRERSLPPLQSADALAECEYVAAAAVASFATKHLSAAAKGAEIAEDLSAINKTLAELSCACGEETTWESAPTKNGRKLLAKPTSRQNWKPTSVTATLRVYSITGTPPSSSISNT